MKPHSSLSQDFQQPRVLGHFVDKAVSLLFEFLDKDPSMLCLLHASVVDGIVLGSIVL